VQNVRLTWADGEQGSLTDLLLWAEGRLLLLVFGRVSPSTLRSLQQLTQAAPLRCVQVVAPEVAPQAKEFVVDVKGHLQGACHVFGHAWALVRPDSYLAATGEMVDVHLVQAVEKCLGI
jgi:3-(3-hydroxy-phenyl)propionate hydroxylase